MKLNWAERWAVNNPLRPLQQNLEIRWFQRRAFLQPGAFVLEVGCGRGAGAYLIKKKFQPAVLHAMDLDIQMIEKSNYYLSPERRAGICFCVSDLVRLPYPDKTMDAVFGFGVLHHIPDWQAALEEIARVLKTGGLYFFEELYPTLYQNFLTRHILLHPKENRFRSRELKKVLSESGLKLADFRENQKLGILGFATRM
jgi:ubiquinone/menaquinone biosynthesis C-methylase UbiE